MEGKITSYLRTLEEASCGYHLLHLAQRIVEDIHHLSTDSAGADLISKFCEKSFLLSKYDGVNSIYAALTSDLPRLRSTIVRNEGLQTLLLVTDYSARNADLSEILRGSFFVHLLRNVVFTSALVSIFTNHHTQALIYTITTNIDELATSQHSSSNVGRIITLASPEFTNRLFNSTERSLYRISSSFGGNLIVQAFISYSDVTSDLVVRLLKGRVCQLASAPNSRFVIQKIFSCGSVLSVRRTYSEIINVPGALESLMTNPYGHYVVQEMLRRFSILHPVIFNIIVGAVLAKEEELQIHFHGVHVLREVKRFLN